MKARVTEGWERLFAATQETDSIDEVGRRAAAWNPLARVPASVYPDFAALRRRVEEMVDGVGRLSVTTFHSFCARVLRSFPAEAGVDPLFEVLPEAAAADAWDAAFRRFLQGEFGGEEVLPEWERILSRLPDPSKAWRVIRRLCLFQRDLLRGPAPDFGSPGDFLDFLVREHGPDVDYFRAFVAGIRAPDDDPAAVAFRDALRVLDAAWEAVSRGDLAAARRARGGGGGGLCAGPPQGGEQKKVPPPRRAETVRGARRAAPVLETGGRGPRGGRGGALPRRAGRGRPRGVRGGEGERARLHGPAAAGERPSRGEPRGRAAARGAVPLHLRGRVPGHGSRCRRRFSGRSRPTRSRGASSSSGIRSSRSTASAARTSRCTGSSARGWSTPGGEDVPLARNFRSRPDLLATLSGLFSRVLSGGEDFSPAYAHVEADRNDPGEGHPVSLYRLDPAVDESEFLAALVGRIVGSVKVRDRGGVERPASFRDIAVLYRSDASGEVLSGYRAALAAAGIPHVVPSRKGFFLRQEIQDVRMVLSAVDVPADRSARHAALKTIFFGLSDEEILPLYGEDPAAVPARVREAVALLSRLSARRGRASLPDLLAALVRGDGGRFRRGADSRRGADRPEPVEGRGDGEGLRMGRRGFPQALPRGDPPQGRRGAGGGRGSRLRGGGGRRPPLHDPRGEGARVPGRDPRGDLPRRPEGAGRAAGGPGAGPLRGDLSRVPDVFGVPAGAGRGSPGDVRGVGEGEDGGGGAPPSLRRGHPREGSALPGGRGEGVRLDPSGRAAGRDRRGDAGRGGPLPRHGASGRAVAAGGIRGGRIRGRGAAPRGGDVGLAGGGPASPRAPRRAGDRLGRGSRRSTEPAPPRRRPSRSPSRSCTTGRAGSGSGRRSTASSRRTRR